MLGIATRTLEMATEHARVRSVSGNVIGRYQAISHSLVDMLIAVEKLRSIVVLAGETYGTPDFPVAVAMAKSAANRTALDNTHRTIQIFGAKGFQWSFPLNFFLRRTIVGVSLFGETATHNNYVLEKVQKPAKVTAKQGQQNSSILPLAITDNSVPTGGALGTREVFQ
jgi:alkylation response protein AidB-like acyl-CoA dehydrogenase